MSVTTRVIPLEVDGKRRPFLLDVIFRLVKEKPLGVVGGVIVIMMVVVAILANFLAPYGSDEATLGARLSPPSAQYLLGTDNLGRDILSRIIYGARISMAVGLGGATILMLVAVSGGLLSGFLGGKVDLITQRFVDAWMCLPPLFLYLTVMSVLGPGLIQVIVVLGVSSGIRDIRIVRSAVIGIKQNMYIEASRAVGVPLRRILLSHILPNIFAPALIVYTVALGSMILTEATLSFLGFGLPPPIPSWGGMLSGPGRQYMDVAPWMVLWPGLALALVVYGINMLGDALRDLLDPRLRGGLGRYGRARVRGPVVKTKTKKG